MRTWAQRWQHPAREVTACSGTQFPSWAPRDINAWLSARVTVGRAPERFPEWLRWGSPLRASWSLARGGCRAADPSSCLDISQSISHSFITCLSTGESDLSVCLSPSKSPPKGTLNQYQARPGTFGGPFLWAPSGLMAVKLAAQALGPDSIFSRLYIL